MDEGFPTGQGGFSRKFGLYREGMQRDNEEQREKIRLDACEYNR